MTIASTLKSLRGDCSGAAMIEFALLGPFMIAMLLGVLQVGLALQNYNALRMVSADVARYGMVQYSTNNMLENSQLESHAMAIAQDSPYLLSGADLTADVADAPTQRVTGAKELTVTMTYQIPSLFSSMGLDGPFISYSRPMFLMQSGA